MLISNLDNLKNSYSEVNKEQFKEIEIKDQIYEDMTNKEEFYNESMHPCLINTTPIIPRQCGTEGVEWSSLSKTQKKKLKTKAKINVMNNLLNDDVKSKQDTVQCLEIDSKHVNNASISNQI